jgi:hypothetical protein
MFHTDTHRCRLYQQLPRLPALHKQRQPNAKNDRLHWPWCPVLTSLGRGCWEDAGCAQPLIGRVAGSIVLQDQVLDCFYALKKGRASVAITKVGFWSITFDPMKSEFFTAGWMAEHSKVLSSCR